VPSSWLDVNGWYPPDTFELRKRIDSGMPVLLEMIGGGKSGGAGLSEGLVFLLFVRIWRYMSTWKLDSTVVGFSKLGR